MTEKLKRFTKLLKDMFELDKSDLDFGIYRIMNIRKNEINNFIENTLTGEVNSILSKYAVDNSKVRQKMEEIDKQCEQVGVKVEDSKLKEEYAEYKTQLSSGLGATELESDVYSALYNFFNRYYDEGDFISKRRYKEGVYAIPYEGEEVKLYWANHDQYYIKSSENFRDYSFKVDAYGQEIIINFKLVEAGTEQNNNVENGDKKREFILLNEDFLEIEGNELTFKFEYRVTENEQDSTSKLRVNTKLNETAIAKMAEAVSVNTDIKSFKLAINMPAPTEKNRDRTILEKHLETYISKNTFDYFIHKDLRRFLNRELDFYIKSEIMHLDDLDTENEVRVDAYLAKVKAIKKVGRLIIDFLAQIEEFQKKLWLKKKFVVETNWCITLDKIDESFYPEIADNDGQRQEWVDLFAVDQIEGNIVDKAYSNPLTVEFLQQNKNLVLDTRYFNTYFKERLIASIDKLDEETDGLLIHSENFQALNLLQESYKEKIQCVYIDPPYNTDASAILYKNDYKDSSWLSMMHNRLELSNSYLSTNGIICVAIDDEEVCGLRFILSGLLQKQAGIVTVRSNPAGRKTKGKFAPAHEYAVFYGKTEGSIPSGLEKTEKSLARYPKVDEKGKFAWANFIRSGSNDKREDRPKLFYPIFVDDNNRIRIPKMEWVESKREYDMLEHPLGSEVVVYPIIKKDNQVTEKNWQRGHLRVANELEEYRIRRNENGNISIDFKTRMDEGSLPITWWDDTKYASANYGALEMKEIFGIKDFNFPKARKLVVDCIRAAGISEESLVLDFFAGSGTTADAVISLNRKDDGNRRYILVEMGNYFNTVTKPRIKKVIYSKDWKDGKPKNRNTGVSQIFKYIRLESYEDTLNNVEFSRTPEQEEQLTLDAKFFNDYLMSYMLYIESRDSLLNLERFKTPFAYKMKITQNNEVKETTIDLVETFNYLLGLTIIAQKANASFNATPDDKGEYENAVKISEDKSGKFLFKTIEGLLPNGNRALVIWRNLTDDLATDNAALDAFFINYSTVANSIDFDIIYVNGDNNLENLRKEKEQWKVELIELEFKKRMFAEV